VLTAVFPLQLRVQSQVVLWAIVERSSARWLDKQQQASLRGLTDGAPSARNQQEHLQQVAVVVVQSFLRQRPCALTRPSPTIMDLHSSQGSA